MSLVLLIVSISKTNYPELHRLELHVNTSNFGFKTFRHKSIFNLFLQDIKRCTGPQSKLTELNAEVKKNFHNLRLRILVRSYISANT